MIKVPSKEYWIKRSELTLITNEKSALQYEQELKKAYLETIQKITKEIEAFYGRYAKDNKISLLEARRRLTPDELLNFNKQSKLYLAEVERLGNKAFTEEYKDYLKQLSGKAYISRLEELTTNIRHNIETLAVGYNEGLGKELKNAYEDSFYRTIFDAQKQAGFGVSFTAPGGKQLETAIRERWMGQNYSERIWADKNKMLINLEQTLAQEFVRGRNPRHVSREYAKKMNTSYHNAQRLIRTELNYISNKGTMKAYKESGVVDSFQYVSTLDNRTSDICREMDGKVFTTKEGQTGVNIPPLHPYCRSTTIPYFPDDEISDLIEDRIARSDDGQGKSYKLGEDVTFFDWAEQYGSPEFRKRVQEQRKRFIGMDMNTSLWDSRFKGLDGFDKDALYQVIKNCDAETLKILETGLSGVDIEITEGVGNYFDINKNKLVLSPDGTERYYETIIHELGHIAVKNLQTELANAHPAFYADFAQLLTKTSNYSFDYDEYGVYMLTQRKGIGGEVKTVRNYNIEEHLPQVKNLIVNKLNDADEVDYLIQSRLSDVYDAVTDGKINALSFGYGGHGADYYGRDYVSKMDETFANLFIGQVTKNHKMENIVKNELPNVYAEWEKLRRKVYG